LVIVLSKIPTTKNTMPICFGHVTCSIVVFSIL